MAIKLTSGNLYFIRDIDYLTGEIGNYVKIGIVTKDRTTEERIKDHQTGNPRGIYPVAEVTDVPFVERLETQLHYDHNEHWVTGEWFLLNDKEVKSIVAQAEHLKAQQLFHKPIIERVLLTLDKALSNGKIKKANKQSLALEQQLIQLKGEINVLKAKIELSKFVFYTLLGANGSIEGVLRIKYAPGKFDFDKKAFEVAHPALYKKYTLPRADAFKHTFSYTNSSKYSLNTIDPGLHASLKALDDTTYS
ncbi:MAG: GIY-YIG nuclease family protein, partial [Flavobacteriia bacterium]|nr:GIY-YIG nuclease family protein [Flavobacteriia bacterium]